ncbi:MAG TPA: glycosyltransferase family 2 protein [Actinomycetota bacterium]|nr:glycosyltransferase family 2 protein [Actinomycetota bacterium]
MASASKAVARAEPPGASSELPSVLAIVVTHRGRAWLRDCLVGLNTQTYPLLDVLVVDDASPDYRALPNLKRIAKRHLKKRRWGFLRTRRPLGFGGAINWALSRIKTDAAMLLFIHDDAALDPMAVERMVARILDDDRTAIVGPKIVAWEDPARLEEVGMAADRFGYPYKGLDESEIDLGQHDASKEVLYVTSTCMLMRHELFRSLRGWDARMRAFSEDLDICWRARVAGYSVRVEPLAVARHAIALAKGQRESPFSPTRYYIRRNRLRTVAKNVSGARLLVMLPLFLVLAIAEMIGFLILRQPGEIVGLARALGWNLMTLPQTMSERNRVQRSRKIPDSKIDRFTVRETTRIRSYMGHQADRLEEAWGRRAELMQRPSLIWEAFGRRFGGWTAVALVVALLGFLLGFRHFLWGPPASIGELLPYPERATALFRAWATPWRGTGLGQPGGSPPALALLGLVQVLTFGAEGVAQKVLVLGLGAAAFGGAHWLVSDLVDRPARVAAGLAYALGAVGYSGLREGALGAMVFGAAAPFVLGAMLRLTGYVRPPRWRQDRAVARVALGAAVSAAFVPGSLILYALCAVVLVAARRITSTAESVKQGLAPCLAGLGAAFLLLLPWSFNWLDAGAPLNRLWGSGTWRIYASSYRGHGIVSVLTGQTPDAPVLFGLALPILGAIAALIAGGQRRKVALALWLMIVSFGALISLTAAGIMRPLVASPVEAGVLASVAFAGLVGLAIGAFRLDLPRRGLGRAHALTLAGVGLAAVLLVAGVLPALFGGEWAPGRSSGRENAATVAQVRSLLASESDQHGQFRVLWIGDGWSPPTPSAARPPEAHFLTGPRGQVLSDLFESASGPGEDRLGNIIESVEAGTLDRAGSLLAAFNVHFIILERGAGGWRWLSQRDLALSRDESSYVVLENQAGLHRVGVYAGIPAYVRALEDGPSALPVTPSVGRATTFEQASSSKYVGDLVSPERLADADPVVYLAEDTNDGWVASVSGTELERVPAEWGNAWAATGSAGESIEVAHPRGFLGFIFLGIVGLAWLVVLEAAVSRSGSPPATRKTTAT